MTAWDKRSKLRYKICRMAFGFTKNREELCFVQLEQAKNT